MDADGFLYTIALGQGRNDSLGGEKLNEKIDIKPLKKHLKALVKDYMKSVEVLSITEDWTPGKVHLIYSDKTNFRYEIFPEYKANRKDFEKTPLFLKFRKWCHKKGIIYENTEADDVVSHYVRNGAVGFTMDKDMLKGVPGIWYDTYHNCWVNTTKEEADRFTLLQSVMGDSTDGIPGLTGKVSAEAFLYEDTWEAVVNAYKGIIPPGHEGAPFLKKDGTVTALIQKIRDRNLTEDDAILTRRLIGMDQWHPKRGVRLWTI